MKNKSEGISTAAGIFISFFISLMLSSFFVAGFIDDYNLHHNQITNTSYFNQTPSFSNSFPSPPAEGDWVGGIIAGISGFFATLSAMFGLWGTLASLILWNVPEFFLPTWANFIFIKTQVVILIISFIILVRGG